MTNYEKKYNEALERARALWREAIEKEYVNDYLKDYETIFPELRESEDFDEKVRKWLVDYFSSIKDTVWIHRNTITCEQILEWLEKQKENPKSADSIPADCASSAKCEDGSLKHSDSFGTDIRDTPAYWRGWDDAMKQKEQKPAWSEAVKWLVDDDYDPQTDKGRFILGSAGIGYNGYYIPYSDLLKLPKED